MQFGSSERLLVHSGSRSTLVNADVKLTRVAEVKLTHLGEDGGFGTAYVDPGAVRGDSGVVSAG